MAGEPVSRPYQLSGTATWDETTHQLVVPAKTAGEALETLTDTFAAGKYAVTLTIQSTSTTPVAYVEVVVNGQTTTTMLTNGTTSLSLSLPDKTNTVTIRIIGTGGDAFTIGDAAMAKI